MVSKKSLWPILVFFLVFASFDVVSQENDFILKACDDELYKSLPVDEAISGNYYTNNQLVDKSSPYAEDLNCTSYIPYPEGGSIVLKFVLFEIEWDDETENCEWDQFAIDGKAFCGILTGDQKCFHGGTQVDLTLTTDDFTDNAYRGIEIHFDTYSTNQCTCVTLPTDTQQSKPCVFPFYFGDTKYWNCVDDVITDQFDTTGSFCATEVNENGVITAAGSCDTDIVECQTVCKTEEEGRRCLFPAYILGVERTSCWKGVEAHNCVVLQIINFDGDQDIGTQLPCGSQCDISLECNAQNLAINSGEFLSPEYGPTNTYPFDTNCAPSVETTAADNYYVTLVRVSMVCDERDFLEFKSSSSSDVAVYRFCGETLDTDFKDFSFCWSSNTQNSVDMSILFKTDPLNAETVAANRYDLRGVKLSFKAAETSETGPCFPKVANDNACSSQNQVINSDSEILSYDYPRPYPSDLDCTWTIEADVTRPGTIPVIEIESVDLGIEWDSITEKDTLTLKNPSYQEDRVITLENDDSDQLPFVLIGQSGTVTFKSTFYFNFHTTFKLNVNYYTIANNTEIFMSAGYCLSEDHTDFCKFPFTENGETYTTCSKFSEDSKASCKNYNNEKIFCDETSMLCIPQVPDFVAGSVRATLTSESSARIDWEVETSNWDKFSVTINEDAPVEVLTESYEAQDLQAEIAYIVMIQIISFGREGPVASISFTHTGETFGVFATSDSPGLLTLNWDEFPNAETSYRISVAPFFTTTVSQNLFVDKTAEAPSTVKGNVYSKSIENLRAGLEYNATVEGFTHNGDTKTAQVETSKFIMPRSFEKDTNQLFVGVVSSGLEIEGLMTESTYCEEINVQVEMLTSTLGMETFEKVSEKQYAVDDCVDSSDFTFNKVIAMQESELTPGASYKILICGSSGGVLAPDQVTLNYIREPEMISDLEGVSWDTSSISVRWDPPSGDYSHFLVHVTLVDDETQSYSKEFKVTEAQFASSDLEPGYTYKFSVKTVSHGDTESASAMESTFGTVPFPASSFSAVRVSTDPSMITFQVLSPETGAWKSMEISSEALVVQQIEGQPLANKEFPIILDGSMLDLQVQYSQKGSLYSATVVVISEFGHRSANITKIFASDPSELDRAELIFMNNEYMVIEWALSKSTSFYNQLAAEVKTAVGANTIFDQVFAVTDGEASGSVNISLQGQSPFLDFTAVFNAITYFSQYDITAKSADSIVTISPVIPVINDVNPVTLTTITTILDLSGFTESDIITVTIDKSDGTHVTTLDLDLSSDCSSNSACSAVFSSLDPGSDYVITSSVKASSLPFRFTATQSVTTDPVPTSFTIAEESTVIQSYSMLLCFNTKPFGDDSYLDKFVLIVGPEGSDETEIFANVQADATWAQNSDSSSPVIYVTSTKLEYSSISLDENDRWKLTVGDATCDPTASSDVCNGPLLPDSGYNFWIAGFTTNGKIVISQKITNLKTTVDDVSNSVVTSDLSTINVQFDHTLPDTAKYTGTISIVGSEEVLSSQEITGSVCAGKCSITFADLDPGSTYTVQVTPQLSGINRPKFTAESTTAELPELTVQQITVEEGVVNPSRAFDIQVTGLPFGSHASVTDFSIIVASSSYALQLTAIPDAKYSDVENQLQFEPYRPLGSQTYPPELTDGKFKVTIGGQECGNAGADAFCNGNLRWNSQFQIWFATVPENSQKAIIRGPYSPFTTAELEIDDPMILQTTILSLQVGYPVEALPDGAVLDIQVLDSANDEVQRFDGISPKEGTGCILSANQNHCILTIQNLDPETEYTIKFVPRDSSIPTQDVIGETRSIPTMDVALDPDNNDPYTTLKFYVTGLPFGQNDDVTAYYVLVSSSENKNQLAYTERVWNEAVNNNWTPYNAFGSLQYANLISQANQQQPRSWGFVIGQEYPCAEDVTSVCNGPLVPGRTYAWTIIVETESGRRFQTNTFDGYFSLNVESTLERISTSLAGMTLQFDKLQSSVITYSVIVSLNNELKASKTISPSQCSESKCEVIIDTLDAADGYVAKLFVNYNNAPAGVAEAEIGSLDVQLVTELVPDAPIDVSQDTSQTKSYTELSLSMNKLPFGDTQSEGGVMSYSVVVSMVTSNNVGGGRRARRSSTDKLKFTNNTWKYSSENGWPPYLIYDPNKVYPPTDKAGDGSWSADVGTEYPCPDDVNYYCNGPLAPGSSFSVAMIGYVGESDYPVISQTSSQLTTQTYKIDSMSNVVSKLTSVDFQFTNGMPQDSLGDLLFKAQAVDSNQQVISTVELNPTSCDSQTNVCTMSVGGLEPGTSYSLVVTPFLKGLPMEPSSPLAFQTITLPVITVTKDDSAENIDLTTQIALRITGLPFGTGVSRIKKYSILIGQSNNNFSQQLQNYPQDIKTYNTAGKTDLYQALPLTDYPPEVNGNDSDVWLFTLGSQQNCDQVQNGEECNGPLSASTSYNIWFVAEIEGYGFLVTTEFGPYRTAAVPGSGSQRYQIANLSPLFIVLGLLLLLIIVVLLFIFMRRRGKIRIYPFLSYFAPKQRKKLYAYEAYDGLSERDSSVPRLHDSPELTNAEPPDAPPSSSTVPDTSRELPYHSTLKSQRKGPSRPIPPFSVSTPSSMSDSPHQPVFLENGIFQFSGIGPLDDSFSQNRPGVIRPNFVGEEDEDGLVFRAPRHIDAERNEGQEVSPHPYLDLASQFN